MEMIESQKQTIQRAALHVFTQKGFAGATIAEIAARAGVNPATIYRHFSGKKELFDSLQRPDLDFPDAQEQAAREAIIHTALSVFSDKGYAAATMDDIAAEVGLSKAGVYFYFPSKESLFAAVVENPSGFALINSAMQTAFSRADADLQSGLVQLALAYLSLFEKEEFSSLLKIILAEGPRNPEIARDFKQKVIGQGSKNVAAKLAQYCTLSHEELLDKVQAFFGMLLSWGIVNRLLCSEKDLPPNASQQIAQEYARIFLFGIQTAVKK